MLDYRGVKISWLGHDGFRIKNGKTLYIDPYESRPGEEADILLISHHHSDHYSPKDIQKIASAKTTVITTAAVKNQLSEMEVKEVRAVKPGQKISVDNITIETVPSYNVNKFRSPGRPFHPKEEEMLGFIITLNDVRIYHAGDTDSIPEMAGLNVDVALLPVSGTYVMTAEEAAEATKQIKPKIAIPMHYGVSIGNQSDAEKFKKLAACEVRILTKE